MAFMQPQITEKQTWYFFETANGTVWVPAELVGDLEIPEEETTEEVDLANAWDQVKAYLEVFRPEDLHEIGQVEGWGVRLSAPGYMDCTDWEVFEDKGNADIRYSELEEEVREGEDD